MRWAGERDQEYCRSASSASAMESKTFSDHFDLVFLLVFEAFRLAIASIISKFTLKFLAAQPGGLYILFGGQSRCNL